MRKGKLAWIIRGRKGAPPVDPGEDLEPTELLTQFSERGITLYLAEPTPVGRYVTNDRHFMVGGSIIATDPPSILIDGTYTLGQGQTEHDAYTNRRIHGGMTNPGRDGGTGINPNLTPNGLDSLPSADGNTEVPFLDAKNTSPEYTGVPITGPATFLKARSDLTEPAPRTGRNKVANWSVTTILGEGEYPRAGPFARWAGNVDKTPVFFERDIDWSRLVQNRVLPDGVTLPTMEYFMSKLGPFQLFWNQWLFARGVTPSELTEHYGAEMMNVFAEAWCAATTIGFPLEDAKTLIRRIMSFGLEIRDATAFGRRWSGAAFAYGGAHQCFKFPMILAAHFLHGADNQDMLASLLAYCDTAQNRIFGDDIMTFEIERIHIEAQPYQSKLTRMQATGYPPYLEGSTGWLLGPVTMTSTGVNYELPYRHINNHPFTMSAYMARLMGMEGAWNNPTFFEYCDHFWDLWKYRGQPFSERFNAVPKAYMLENYETISPNYQDLNPPVPVSYGAEKGFVWIKANKNFTLAYQPRPEDLEITVGGVPVDLSGVTTTASGVKSIPGSTPQNAHSPVISVDDPTGFQVGVRLICSALKPDTFVSSVDVPTKTIGISTWVQDNFTDQPISTSRVMAYERALAARIPTDLVDNTSVVTIRYIEPASDGVRSLGGAPLESFGPTVCLNQTGLLPDGPTEIQSAFSGADPETRQFSSTRAPRSELFNQICVSIEYVLAEMPYNGMNILSAVTAASTRLQVYHVGNTSGDTGRDLRVAIGGQGLRFPGAFAGAPIGKPITIHLFLDIGKTVLADAIKGAVVWEGGGNTNLSTTGTTYTRDGSDLFDIATVLTGGLHAFSPASGSDPLHGAIRKIMIGWGVNAFTLPADFSGPGFAWNADWGPNGQNVWGHQNQGYWAGTVVQWNGSVPNAGNYGGWSMTPGRHIDDDPEFGLLTEYTEYVPPP
ncbi:MAG: hypothetical protein U1C74_20675 [Phenylobacterium sp.]|nr:hypothetical protein [Phenylobacterium sp.]